MRRLRSKVPALTEHSPPRAPNWRQRAGASPHDEPPSRLSSPSSSSSSIILITIWHMATTGALFDDPGTHFSTRRNPEKAKHRAIEQLRAMGYQVIRDPPQEPA
jgi:hypothetical protein